MGYKSIFLKPYARTVANSLRVKSRNAVKDQDRIRKELVKVAKKTAFGKKHDFGGIKNYKDFKSHIPIIEYEELRPYIERIIQGEKDILWPGKPKYLAKTSGTTSGAKYIPLTKASAPTHITSARTALFNYSYEWKNDTIWDGKVIFLSGSPKLELTGKIPTGRLSGIVNHMVPSWLKPNQLPSYQTNIIEDWESKLDKIVDETIREDMRLISGIPPWLVMYFERLLEKSGAENIKTLFPNFSILMHGGVNFEPYKSHLDQLIGGQIDYIETYPASEGFIAFEDRPEAEGLLLNTFSGMFFEFIPANEIHSMNPTRVDLREVQTGVNYAIVLNTNAGLWGYLLGDTIQFTKLNPFLIKVTGRIKHYISAFGEHVIGKEVDQAISLVAKQLNINIKEYTVAPQVNPQDGELPYHEWFVEFQNTPTNLRQFADKIDLELRAQNAYYDDLIRGSVIRPLVLRVLPQGSFVRYMKSIGKLGGQNKLPRLANDRKIAEQLLKFVQKQKHRFEDPHAFS